jgi:hypothetical protein
VKETEEKVVKSGNKNKNKIDKTWRDAVDEVNTMLKHSEVVPNNETVSVYKLADDAEEFVKETEEKVVKSGNKIDKLGKLAAIGVGITSLASYFGFGLNEVYAADVPQENIFTDSTGKQYTLNSEGQLVPLQTQESQSQENQPGDGMYTPESTQEYITADKLQLATGALLPTIQKGIGKTGLWAMEKLGLKTTGTAGKILKGLASSEGLLTSAKALSKMGLKEGAKFAGKTLAKKLPLLGLLTSGYFAYDRLKEGDVIGAGLEITSGLLSTVPVIGTAASFGVDALTLAYDMYGRDKLKGVNQGLMNVGHGIAGGLNWGYDKLKQTTGINNIFAATPIGSAAMVVDPLLKTIGMPTIAGTTNWLYDKGSQMISHPIGTLAAVGGIAGMLFTKRGRATISKTATGVISKGLEKLPKSIDEVKKIISDISKKLKIDGLLEAIRSIKTSVSETLKRFNLDGITSSLKSLTSIWNGLKGKITNGINSIISKFGIVQTISNTINTVKGYASKLASGIINLPKTISSTETNIYKGLEDIINNHTTHLKQSFIKREQIIKAQKDTYAKYFTSTKIISKV